MKNLILITACLLAYNLGICQSPGVRPGVNNTTTTPATTTTPVNKPVDKKTITPKATNSNRNTPVTTPATSPASRNQSNTLAPGQRPGAPVTTGTSNTTGTTVSSSAQPTTTPGKRDFKTRAEVIEEIVKTSPKYQELAKTAQGQIDRNGGAGLGVKLVGSPKPKTDQATKYSKTFDYVVNNSTADKVSSLAKFSFDPVKKKLYTIDPVTKAKKSVPFDNSLLPALMKLK